jgi:hypothetical protein
MRYSILLMAVCVFTFGNKVSAQSTFFNLIEGWVNNFSIEEDEGYLSLGLNSLDAGPSNHGFQYNYITFTGEEMNSLTFVVDSVETTSSFGMSQMAVKVNNKILRTGSIGFSSTLRVYGALFSYDLNSQETDLSHIYDASLNNQLYTIALKNDSSLLLGGQISNNAGTTSLFLHETDLSGEPRWTYTTECGNNCFNYAEHILPLDNGNTVLLYREWDYAIGNQDKERAVLVMIDPLGEELWRAYPGNDEEYKILPGGVLEQDGELLVCFTDPYLYEANGDWVAYFESSVYFENYDFSGELAGSFNLLGQIPDGSAEELPILFYDITQMQFLSDGNILLSGFTGIHGNLIKMTPTGEVLWFREFTPFPLQPDNPNFYEYTRILHTLPTSDGGFLCTGTYRSDPREEYPQGIQTAIALKVDEFGCLEEGCEITSVEELSSTLSSPIKVWPNPVTGNHFTLESQVDLHIESIVLVDVQGRRFSIEVESGKQLRSGTSSAISCDRKISSGLYTLLITTSEGVAYSLKLVFEE